MMKFIEVYQEKETVSDYTVGGLKEPDLFKAESKGTTKSEPFWYILSSLSSLVTRFCSN